MKKMYTTFALAVAVSLTVSGAEKFNSQSAANSEVSSTTLMTKTFENTAAKVAKSNAPQKISKVDELYGKYKMAYWGLTSNAPKDQVTCVTISASEKGGSTVEITGMPYTDVTYEGSVDFDNMTLTIPQQIAFYHPGYAENVMFVTESGSDDTEKYPAPADGALVLNIGEDGSLTAVNWWDAAVLKCSAGYFWGGCEIRMSPLKVYSFDASKWKDVGTCSYTDGFMLPGFLQAGETQATYPPYTCKVLQNTEYDAEFAIVNPYGENSIFAQGNAFPERGGNIIVNIENPECVAVRPLVGSGMWIDDSEEGAAEPFFVETYCFNTEGNKLYNMGVSTEDQVEEVYIVMDDDEELSDYLSYYDADTRTATILSINSYFALSEAPLSLYYWTKQDPQKPNDPEARVRNMFDTKIVFDFDPVVSGVNDVLVEDANAPVKYYNLQGMEVVNPEAGQVVIKKQGGKSTKFIAK